MLQRMEHTGMTVKDLERSVSFYTEVVGFQLLGRLDHPNGSIKMAFIGTEDKNRTKIELLEGYHDSLPAEGKVHHLVLKAENVEEETARLKDAGARFIETEITELPNGARYLFVEGPDGNGSNYLKSINLQKISRGSLDEKII
ncbi:VOC family protein [Pseudobacillus badius]|uniref:VOC family protein n=1 Tax=Bacillus badius TaxID=1455 RepID=UPI003CEF490B